MGSLKQQIYGPLKTKVIRDEFLVYRYKLNIVDENVVFLGNVLVDCTE